MRSGTDSGILGVLAQSGITTAWCVWLDFASGPVGIWTGSHALTVNDPSDATLNGKTFDPLNAGILYELGDNSFSTSGSESLTLSIGIPSSPNPSIAAASVLPGEYQARNATVWRALMEPGATSLAPPIWRFRRIRSGSMDKVEVTHDGTKHLFKLIIESHASLISNASGSTYLDQKRFDETDTSNDYTAKVASGGLAPGGSTGSVYLGGGGGIRFENNTHAN